MLRCCGMLRAEMSSTMELLPLLCLCVLSCSGSTSAAGAEPVNVKKGSDAILPCNTTEDITYKRLDWKKDGQKQVYLYDGAPLSGQYDQFIGRVSNFPEELKKGNASIIIRNTTVTDSGEYTCALPGQKVLIYLQVGTASKPIIPDPVYTPNGVVLLCVVHGETFKPDVQWKDSKGKLIPAENAQVSKTGVSYDIILKATVTEPGNYSCVATQKEISHQIDAQTCASPGAAPEPGPETQTGWIIAVGAVCTVVGLALGVCGILTVQTCRR